MLKRRCQLDRLACPFFSDGLWSAGWVDKDKAAAVAEAAVD